MLAKSVKMFIAMSAVAILIGFSIFFPINVTTSAFAKQNNITDSHKIKSHLFPKNTQPPNSANKKKQKCNEHYFCVKLKHPHTQYAIGGKYISKKDADWPRKHDPDFLHHQNVKAPKGHPIGDRKNNR